MYSNHQCIRYEVRSVVIQAYYLLISFLLVNSYAGNFLYVYFDFLINNLLILYLFQDLTLATPIEGRPILTICKYRAPRIYTLGSLNT